MSNPEAQNAPESADQEQALKAKLALIGRRIIDAQIPSVEILNLVNAGVLSKSGPHIDGASKHTAWYVKSGDRKEMVAMEVQHPDFHTGKGWAEPTLDINSYDDKGRLIRKDAVGSFKQWWSCCSTTSYHKNGKVEENADYGGCIADRIDRYDEQGRITESVCTRKGTGEVKNKTIHTYSQDGLEITVYEYWYHDNKQVAQRGTFEQLGHGKRLEKRETLDPKGSLVEGVLKIQVERKTSVRGIYDTIKEIRFALDEQGLPVRQEVAAK